MQRPRAINLACFCPIIEDDRCNLSPDSKRAFFPLLPFPLSKIRQNVGFGEARKGFPQGSQRAALVTRKRRQHPRPPLSLRAYGLARKECHG